MIASPPNLHVLADLEALARAAAQWLCEKASAGPAPFAVSLAGGSTPRRMYQMLATDLREKFPWTRVHWFFGDERFVTHDHRDSNYRMVREALFAPAQVPAENIHPISCADLTPAAAAAAYERELRTFFGADADRTGPLFGAVLLGLGEDGHIASLFPGTASLGERKRWVTAVIGATPEPRITLTYSLLERSRDTAFIVASAGKRDALARVWQGDDLPVARLRPQGALHWFIDRAADPR